MASAVRERPKAPVSEPPRPAPKLTGSGGSAARAPAPIRPVLRSPGPGDAVPAAVAVPVSRSIGVDISAVRVHSDRSAAVASDLVSARAFTFGSHVFLGAGERPTDLPLMAHEIAHAVQQESAAVGPRVQLFGGATAQPLELEARAASLAVARGEPFLITGRAGGSIVQRQAGEGGIRGRVLGFIRDHAKQIPGYDLLAFVLGRDPITQQPVERTAVNLIRAAASLIPGGREMFDNLMQAGVIQKAGDWFMTEVAKLNLTWDMIRGLFSRAWDALGVTDLWDPSGAWEKIKGIFGPPVQRLVDFAIAGGKKLLEFIFEGALALAGAAGQRVLAIFRKIGETFSLIVADPIAFLGHLLDAVKGGFNKFVVNIVDHLKRALFEWLTGTLGGVIQLPSKWDLRGIISVILQVLGLTYHRMREKLVKLIGEPAVKAIETAFDFLKAIVTGGLAAAWNKLLEFATGLVDTVVSGIRDWVVTSIVKAAVTKLVTMFNPVGAIIQGIITIYNTVMFFIERAQQIAALVESVVDSINNIARGNIGAAIDYVETTLGRTLPVIISFLARLIGLGDIAGAVKGIITRIQNAVSTGVDKLVAWVINGAKGIIARMAGGGTQPTAPATQPASPGTYIYEQKEGTHSLRVMSDLSVVQFSAPSPVPPATAQKVEQAALESVVKRTPPNFDAVDPFGRATGPDGHVQDVKESDDRDAMTAAHLFGYLPGDQRGHLIGDRFHGPARPGNLVPMNPTLNLSSFKTYENLLATTFRNLVKAGKAALLYMKVIPTYPTDDPTNPARFRPTHVTGTSKVTTLKAGATTPTPVDTVINSGALPNPAPAAAPLKINDLALDAKSLTPLHLQDRLVDALVKERAVGRFSSFDGMKSRLLLRMGPAAVLIQELDPYENRLTF